MEEMATIASTARVWIYMADRVFTKEEEILVEKATHDFTAQWAAHGKGLTADSIVKYGRFIILMVDESQYGASGCSIDSSVRFIKELGEQLQIDFFNRLLMAYKDENGNVQTIHQSKLPSIYADGIINEQTIVFNNLVKTKGELDSNWETPLSESFYKRLI
ncbi:MAG: ABC transporter ATPase [Bacteroidetes bacterium]|nr:ABC transporter ATPase [Bacteroidota bacterium]